MRHLHGPVQPLPVFPGDPPNCTLPPQSPKFQPSSCGPGLLSKPACLLPSSWQAACWEPVAIETRPRRMLQDSGKRDALMCRLQRTPCPCPHPENGERTHYFPCLPHGFHLGFCPGHHPPRLLATLASALGAIHPDYWPPWHLP